MFGKKTLRDVNVKNKTILLRTDYNVPLDSSGHVSNDLRIRASLATIEYLIKHQASKIIIISHLGRPAGKRQAAFSLKPIAMHLQSLLPETSVNFVDDVSGPDVETAVASLGRGAILLLENLRFYPGEEKNSEDYVAEIIESTHADIFVQDAFAVTHRSHASTDAITQLLPSVAGLLLEKEVTELSIVMHKPARPLLVIIGGAKVLDKQPIIDSFLNLADYIAVGGKIAADGYSLDNPKVYVAEDFISDDAGLKLDIGPKSIASITELIQQAKTIVWNGLLGKSELPRFMMGSLKIAEAMAISPAKTIIGGGDTVAFVEKLQQSQTQLRYSLISTGGGATLEFLSGAELPGILALENK